jgi:hypothetical protein
MVSADMPGEGVVRSGGQAARTYSGSAGGGGGGGGDVASLGDILERILDKGLVIAGDIRVNLLDIELLTIKLRLVIASLETAREVGINWWENDPWLSADGSDRAKLADENRELRARIAELEDGGGGRRAVAGRAEEATDDEEAEGGG